MYDLNSNIPIEVTLAVCENYLNARSSFNYLTDTVYICKYRRKRLNAVIARKNKTIIAKLFQFLFSTEI